MGAPAIFEKQIEIKLLHPASTSKSRIQVCALPNHYFEDWLQAYYLRPYNWSEWPSGLVRPIWAPFYESKRLASKPAKCGCPVALDQQLNVNLDANIATLPRRP
ncbi:MAG: hypothetical protein P8X74_09420 [Reinekea sp.]|jgi:hypothetical protein